MKKQEFKRGIIAGIPICLGYLSVSFAFGIFAVDNGLSIAETVLISMTNVTSAGQLAAVPIIATGGSLIELIVAQIVINLRYALMSVTLSQKLSGDVRLIDRLLIAFVNTDEVFGVAASQEGSVKRSFLYGLILTPYLGWSIGTVLGSAAGNILPSSVVSALGIAIYAMFVAICVPPAKKNRSAAGCILLSIALSCLFFFVPALHKIPSGFTVIICAVTASTVFAFLAPIETDGTL